jgi:peptide-methionine (S)-S-oxide reductase
MRLHLLALTALILCGAPFAWHGPDPGSAGARADAKSEQHRCHSRDAAEPWNHPYGGDMGGIVQAGRYPVAPERGIEPPSDSGRLDNGVHPAGDSGKGRTELATFGMGCFWGAEADFCGLDGVVDTEVGYAGGHSPDPTYHEVSSGRTGHAEVVQVRFDPSIISYEQLLEVFWRNHDSTTPNRQGPDVGSQYRSLILFHGPEQEKAVRASLERHARRLSRPIVTRIQAATDFYPAEDYHQRYLERRGRASCNR